MAEFHSDEPSNYKSQVDSRFSKSAFLERGEDIADFCPVINSSSIQDARDAIQNYSDKHGKTLPPLSIIEIGGDSVSTASYRLGAAMLMLKGVEPGSMEFAITLAHEVKHSEQDLLMLWHIADKHNAGKTLSPEQRLAIKKDYQASVGSTLQDELLDAMLKSRDGKILDSDSKKRAESLMAAIKDDREHPNNLASLKGQQEFLGELYQYQQTHNGREAIQKLFALADLNEQARKFYGGSLFGDGILSRELIIQKFGDPSKKDFNELKAGTLLFQQMKSRDTELVREMQEQFMKYAGRNHEAEAFAVESKVQKACTK